MAASSIIWNGVTLTFPRPVSSWVHDINVNEAVSKSSDGHHYCHHRHYLWRVHMTLKGCLTAEQERDLYNWWAWAMAGEHYAVAYDSTKTLDTTLDAGAAAAQKVIPLTATATADPGDMLVLTKADRSYFETLLIDTVSAGVSVTSTTDLNRAFVSGDSCRHLHYLPQAITVSRRAPIRVESPGGANSLYLDHTFEEDL